MNLIKLFLVLSSIYVVYAVKLGGWDKIPFSKVPMEVQHKAKELIVSSYNSKTNNYFFNAFLRFDDKKNAWRQIVAGSNYGFDVILVPTKCINNGKSSNSLTNCRVADGPAIRCTIVIYYRAWENKMELTKSDCNKDLSVEQTDFIHLDHEMILGHDGHDIGTVSQFEEFLKKHNKKYNDDEYNRRFKIFSSNMKRAHLFQQLDLGDARYGASPFADLTEKEFRKYYLTPAWDLSKLPPTVASDLPLFGVPTSFDWREKGAVTNVKNQGSCGSCWAFSTTGNIEGQWFLKKNKLVSLSEQELVDCDKVDQGCGGGLPSNAYKEIIRIGGLETETDYPYRGQNMKCSFNKEKVAANISGSLSISKDETQMAAWLASNGPISIGINANAMQFYMGGVSHPWKIFCNPRHLDHGVLIVGYGVKGTEPYWIIKNSWGPVWGEKGYYLVYRGSGVCGLNTACTSAIVK